MKTGISIYLFSPLQDIERTIERGAAAGARYAFTSLHIPEDGGAAYADKVRHVLSLLSARGIALIADVGPRTCDLLGLERIEDLRDLGLEYLRLDYGFSASRTCAIWGWNTFVWTMALAPSGSRSCPVYFALWSMHRQ